MILSASVVAGISAYFVYKNRKKIKSTVSQTTNSVVAYVREATWDIHTNRRIATLHPDIREDVRVFINMAEKELGIKLRVTSALRTWSEQSKLYNQGRTTPGKIVTNAKAGESYHNYGLAFDVVEIKNGQPIWNNPKWLAIGALGKRLGFEWGGDWKFKDKPHFQKRFGRHHSQLAALYNSGKSNGNYILLT